MEFSATVDINRPVEEVFAQFADVERAPEWSKPVAEREKLTEGPVGVGTTYRAVDKAPGRTLRHTMTVTAFEPNRRMAVASTEKLFGGWETRFEGNDNRTTLTFRQRIDLPGPYRLLAPVIGFWGKRQLEADLQRFKERVERS